MDWVHIRDLAHIMQKRDCADVKMSGEPPGDTEGVDDEAMGWPGPQCPSEREEFSSSVLMLPH